MELESSSDRLIRSSWQLVGEPIRQTDIKISIMSTFGLFGVNDPSPAPRYTLSTVRVVV